MAEHFLTQVPTFQYHIYVATFDIIQSLLKNFIFTEHVSFKKSPIKIVAHRSASSCANIKHKMAQTLLLCMRGHANASAAVLAFATAAVF